MAKPTTPSSAATPISNAHSNAVATPEEIPAAPLYPLHLNREAEEWFKSLSPGAFESYKDIESTWNHPFTQFSVTLVRDPQFREAVTEIHTHPKLTILATYEVVWLVLIFLFRAWRLQKANSVLTRIWAQTWVGILSFTGVFFLIPALVWGEAYRTVLAQLLKALFKHFLV